MNEDNAFYLLVGFCLCALIISAFCISYPNNKLENISNNTCDYHYLLVVEDSTNNNYFYYDSNKTYHKGLRPLILEKNKVTCIDFYYIRNKVPESRHIKYKESKP